MVTEVRNAEKALGKVSYQITAEAQKNMLARRSLYFCKSMKAGDVITESTVRSVRPGFGLHPKYHEQILGLKMAQDVEFGDRVSAEMIQGFEV